MHILGDVIPDQFALVILEDAFYCGAHILDTTVLIEESEKIL